MSEERESKLLLRVGQASRGWLTQKTLAGAQVCMTEASGTVVTETVRACPGPEGYFMNRHSVVLVALALVSQFSFEVVLYPGIFM